MVRSATSSEVDGVANCSVCGSELAEGARFCTECGEPVAVVAEPAPEVAEPAFDVAEPAPEVAEPASEAAEPAAEVAEPSEPNPWVPEGALEPAVPDRTAVMAAPVTPSGTRVTPPGTPATTSHTPAARSEGRVRRAKGYRWHPVGGLLAVLAGVAVIAGTFFGLLSLSVNGVRSPTVTVWRANDTMAVPAVVERGSDGSRRAAVSTTKTTTERLRSKSAPLFSLDPTPGQDRWILLAAGVIAVVVGSTAILRSRLVWRLVLLLDGLLVGVVAARYLVGLTRNVIDGYRAPGDLTLRIALRTHVELGLVLLFAASAALVVAAVCSAFGRRAGSLDR